MGTITTLIPTFRRPQLLEKAVRSVLNQTYQNFVIYICDNASGDETQKVVEKLQKENSRIRAITREKNIGLLANFQAALDCIKTPFFHFFSDDDFIFPWFYETAMKGFQKYPDAGISHCRTLNAAMQNNGSYKLLSNQFSSPYFEGYLAPPQSLVKVASILPTWTGTVFRKDVLDITDHFDPQIGPAFDCVFNCQAASRHPVVFHRKPGALFVIWEKSMTGRFFHPDSWTNYENFLKNILKVANTDISLHDQISKILSNHIRLWVRRVWLDAILKRDFVTAHMLYEKISKQELQRYGYLVPKLMKITGKVPFSHYGVQPVFALIKSIRQMKNFLHAKRTIRIDRDLWETENWIQTHLK